MKRKLSELPDTPRNKDVKSSYEFEYLKSKCQAFVELSREDCKYENATFEIILTLIERIEELEKRVLK
jgi:hypothetical protein